MLVDLPIPDVHERLSLNKGIEDVYERLTPALIFLRHSFGNELVLVTPGIRGVGEACDDQARTATPREAIEAGADYLVIGRPILDAPDPDAALERILQSIT